MTDDRELQREVARVALGLLGGTLFVLAGSGAIREHGLVDRETLDVDLFTDELDPVTFDAQVDTLVAALPETDLRSRRSDGAVASRSCG